jgi:ubiquinone biosynthesis protein UbiJ
VVPNVVLELIAEKLSWSALLDPEARPELAQWVHITGQAALAQTISDLVQDLRPDPEDALAQWVGDIPARRLVRGAQSLFGAAQSLARGLTQNMAEYLAEESGTLAGTPALAVLDQTRIHTLAHLEQLAQRQAALQARLQRLAAPPGARA